MSRIFLSHSSSESAAALALRDWLVSEGWDDLFLDLDPERGIAAGERWERALNQAASRCEAVVFLISRAWLASSWCRREMTLALRLNKRLFGVLIEEIAPADLPAELTGSWQVVRLAGGADHRMFRTVLPDGRETHVTFSASGLTQLRTGLARAGLDPRFFAWPPEGDPGRAPWRGMLPLEAGDAGIFFGREAPLVEAMDRLRGMTEGAPPRLMAILGASGAGKSSFLRAGLLPRLARDDRHFLPLPAVRPERAVLSGEAEGLVTALVRAHAATGLPLSRAEAAAAVAQGVEALRPHLARLAEAARPPGDGAAAPVLLLPLDQAEELFNAAGRAEAEAFLTLLAGLLAGDAPRLLCLATIRSDGYERLQSARALEGLRQQTFSLPPLPRGQWANVIEGPAARAAAAGQRLKLDPALTAALLADTESGGGRDALPLLAFTLGRLWHDHGGKGALALADYRAMGGIAGSVDAAVERAFARADADPAVPQDRAARLALLRRGLIPWLAGIDPDTGTARRLSARLSDIPPEARPVIEHLVTERLLSKEQGWHTGADGTARPSGEPVIEPVHEALLRQWGSLRGWLEEDFARLAALEALRRAARDWAANARDAAWLNHRAGRLEDAERLADRPDLWARLDDTDRDYLAQCRKAETETRDRELAEARKLAEAERARRRWATLGSAVAAALALLAGLAGTFALQKANEADRQAAEAVENESVGLAALSRVALEDDRPADAMKLVLASWPRIDEEARPQLLRSIAALSDVFLVYDVSTAPFVTYEMEGVRTACFSPDGRRVLTVVSGATAQLWDAATGLPIGAPMPRQLGAWMNGADCVANFSADGTRVVTALNDNTARVWDAHTGEPLGEPMAHDDAVNSAAFSPDGERVVTASDDGMARLWDGRTGEPLSEPLYHLRLSYLPGQGAGGKDLTGYQVIFARFSADGKVMLTAGLDGVLRFWDGLTGAELTGYCDAEDIIVDAILSPDGDRVALFNQNGLAMLCDWRNGQRLNSAMHFGAEVASMAFSPDGAMLVTAGNRLQLWDGRDGSPLPKLPALPGFPDTIRSVAFSSDGERLLVTTDGFAQLVDAATGETIGAPMRDTNDYGINAAAFSADGRQVVTAGPSGTFHIWDGQDGSPVPTPGWTMIDRSAMELVVSRDGSRIAALNPHESLLLDAEGSELARLEVTEGKEVRAIFAAAGGTLLLIDALGRVALVDAATGKRLAGLPVATVKLATFSQDGEVVAIAESKGTVRFWDGTSGAARPLAALAGTPDARVTAMAFSPDGTQLAVARADGGIALHSVAETEAPPLWRMRDEAEAGPASVLTFSPDGSRLLSLAEPGIVHIHDSATGTPLGPALQEAAPITHAVFSSNGAAVITGSEHGVLRRWTAATALREPIPALRFTGRIAGLSLSPDGSVLLVQDGNYSLGLTDAATLAPLASLTWSRASFIRWAGFVRAGDETRVAMATPEAIFLRDIDSFTGKDVFQIACERLAGNLSLDGVAERYHLSGLAPICGDTPPLPVDPEALR